MAFIYYGVGAIGMARSAAAPAAGAGSASASGLPSAAEMLDILRKRYGGSVQPRYNPDLLPSLASKITATVEGATEKKYYSDLCSAAQQVEAIVSAAYVLKKLRGDPGYEIAAATTGIGRGRCDPSRVFREYKAALLEVVRDPAVAYIVANREKVNNALYVALTDTAKSIPAPTPEQVTSYLPLKDIYAHLLAASTDKEKWSETVKQWNDFIAALKRAARAAEPVLKLLACGGSECSSSDLLEAARTAVGMEESGFWDVYTKYIRAHTDYVKAGAKLEDLARRFEPSYIREHYRDAIEAYEDALSRLTAVYERLKSLYDRYCGSLECGDPLPCKLLKRACEKVKSWLESYDDARSHYHPYYEKIMNS